MCSNLIIRNMCAAFSIVRNTHLLRLWISPHMNRKLSAKATLYSQRHDTGNPYTLTSRGLPMSNLFISIKKNYTSLFYAVHAFSMHIKRIKIDIKGKKLKCKFPFLYSVV